MHSLIWGGLRTDEKSRKTIRLCICVVLRVRASCFVKVRLYEYEPGLTVKRHSYLENPNNFSYSKPNDVSGWRANILEMNA